MSPYANYHSAGYGGQAIVAKDIMEHLQLLKWYCETKLAQHRLELVARHADDPQWIKDKEEEWLNERKYWNNCYSGSNWWDGDYD